MKKKPIKAVRGFDILFGFVVFGSLLALMASGYSLAEYHFNKQIIRMKYDDTKLSNRVFELEQKLGAMSSVLGFEVYGDYAHAESLRLEYLDGGVAGYWKNWFQGNSG